MPHRRHRVRVHVHNRYVRKQSPNNNCCKRRCRNGSRCRNRYQRGDDDLYRLDNDCDRPVGPCTGKPDQRGCQRFRSAEEVCRRRCGRARGQRVDRVDGPCDRCGKSRTPSGGCGCKRSDGGGSRPGTPCERFKSAEETCRACPRGLGRRQSHEDYARTGPSTNYNVYTAQVQQAGLSDGAQVQRPKEKTGPRQTGQPTTVPPCPDRAGITEEIIHTREHRWHIPSAQHPAAIEREEPDLREPRHGVDPCDPVLRQRETDGPSPGSPDASQRPAARPRQTPGRESGSDGGTGRPASVAGVRLTRSELLAGRQVVARIARQVELDDGTLGEHQLVYRLSAQYGAQLSDSDSGSVSGTDSGRRLPLSDPEATRTTQTAQTVLRLERLRLEDLSDTASSSGGGVAVSPRPAPRSARPAEPPSPLPRRQVRSEPTLPAPPAPSPTPTTRVARSLDCQPLPAGSRGRTKKLRTRGALTRLRQLSVTRLNEERQRQLLSEQLVTQTDHQTAGKPSPNQPSDAEDNARRDVTVLHAQNLLPADYQGPGSRGDAANEPLYQNIDTLYDSTAMKPGSGPGYNGGGGRSSPTQPASPYLTRADDPYQPGTSQNGNNRGYSNYGGRQSPYLETSPIGRSARDRFDDEDQLGAALYEQRYQPRRDDSPYLSRPTDRDTPVPGTDTRAGVAETGAPLRRQGAPLQRQGGRQQLGGGRRVAGIGQKLTRGFSSLRQRGVALYRRLSGGRGRGRAPLARPGGAEARRRPPGREDGCSCTDSDSEPGAVNCSFLFYFNGDGGSSPFMCNMPAAITGMGNSRRGAGTLSKKYCDMCD